MFQINYKNRLKSIILENYKKKFTYIKLKQNIIKLNSLSKKKLLVLLISDNSFDNIEIYISLIQSKHILILVESKIGKNEVIKISKNYKPDIVFYPKNFSKISLFKKKISYKFSDSYKYTMLYNSFKSEKNKNLKLLLPTSGSMGSRKFVKLTKKNIKSNTKSIVEYLKLNKSHKCIVNMPIAYSYMMSIINTHFLINAKIYHSNQTMLESGFWKFFNKKKISSFNGVPLTYQFLLKLKLTKIFKNKIKYMTIAGGKLEKSYLKEILKFTKKNNIKLYNMYGQTEASPRISYLNPNFSLKKIGSIGKSIKNSKMWLTDKNKQVIKKPFREGEVNFQGPGVFQGYCSNYKELHYKKQQKILKTGDLAYYDKSGFFYITGRNNRISKVQGIRINLDELQILMKKNLFNVVCKEIDNKIKVFFCKNYNYKKLLSALTNLTKLNLNSFNLKKIKNFPLSGSNKIEYNKLL